MRVLLSLLCLLLCGTLDAQYEHLNNDVFEVKNKGVARYGLLRAQHKITKQYGFIDTTGVVQIEFKYLIARPFSDVRTFVFENDFGFVIDTLGYRVGEKKYHYADKLINGLLVAREHGQKYGVLDEEEHYVVPPVYDHLTSYDNTCFVASKDGKYGVIDIENRPLIPLEYEQIKSYRDKLFFLKQDDKWAIRTNSGEMKSPFIYDVVGFFPEDDYVYLFQGEECVFCDAEGNIVENLEFDWILPLKEGFRPAEREEKWGFLNADYELVIPYQYANVTPFKNQLARVKNGDGKSGLINTKGEEVLPLEFDNIRPLDHGLFLAIKGDSVNLYRSNGELLIDMTFELNLAYGRELYHVRAGLIGVFKDGRYGVIDIEGQWHIDLVYQAIKIYKDGFVAVSTAGHWGLIDLQKKFVLPLAYDAVLFEAGYGFRNFRKDRKQGLVSKDSIVIEPMYDEIGAIENGLSIVRLGDRYGLVDTFGQLVLPVEYELIANRKLGGGFAIQQNGKYGFYDATQRSITIEPTYENLTGVYNGPLMIAQQNGKFGLINKANEQLLPFEYDVITCRRPGIHLEKEGKHGVLTKDGEPLMPVKYDEIKVGPYGAMARKGEQWEEVLW